MDLIAIHKLSSKHRALVEGSPVVGCFYCGKIFDSKEVKDWVDKGELPFTINGGREAGYKGYSWQTNLGVGKWRVFVQSERGQVLGKLQFTVERPTTAQTPLIEIVR